MIDLNAKSVVPFGKYKGQPVEVLAQDKSYVEWMLAQDWFRERYAGLHTLIINNFSTDSETPEHNSLQVLFLDDAFCFSFVKVCEASWVNRLHYEPLDDASKSLKSALGQVSKEIADYVERIRKNTRISEWERDRYNTAVDNERAIVQSIKEMPRSLTYDGEITHKQFEMRGVDVVFWCNVSSREKIPHPYSKPDVFRDSRKLEIEIKPAVGDDYPAILRQMKVNGSSYLFTQRYTGTGATKEQFVQTMKLSGIEVVFRSDLDGQHS